MRYCILLIFLTLFTGYTGHLAGQSLANLGVSTSNGLQVEKFILSDNSEVDAPDNLPLFSFELNGRFRRSDDVNATLAGTRFLLSFEESLRVSFISYGAGAEGWHGRIVFENQGFDTLEISNVVPFGESKDKTFITGKGPWQLARAKLHRPGYQPVRVILPDNAWEMGYSSFAIKGDLSVCSISRRTETSGADKRRYSTSLPPRSMVAYDLYGDTYRGPWQEGVRLMFAQRYLFDLDTFDNSLYERDDLNWIKHSYLIALQFAWDRNFFDRFTGRYTYGEFIRSVNKQFGYLDVFGIWPTWPRLGIDERNQWDLYEDLPGGTVQLRNFARMSRQYGTRFFISYNPWDQSTRQEDHYAGITRLVKDIEADGVVLDTRGNSSLLLQAAADSARAGVVMYSEGMAVPKDMPGIVSGRVHNAIFLSPELNLNKVIKPDFAIFRVCDVGEAPLYREIGIAFLNGYGTELNFFRPGRDHDLESDYSLLARTTRILRENTDAFLSPDWVPLVETGLDNLFINKWPDGQKTIYTVYSDSPTGINSPVLKINNNGNHFVSLWHYQELSPEKFKSGFKVRVHTEPFEKDFSGSRKEGSLDCIGSFPQLLKIDLVNDSLKVTSSEEGEIRIWNTIPSYDIQPFSYYHHTDTVISMSGLFPNWEGKIIIQLFKNGSLSDVRIINKKGGQPWIVIHPGRTEVIKHIPNDMVLVPGNTFDLMLSGNDNFIPYHESGSPHKVKVDTFLIDKYPVTNLQFYNFLIATGYVPKDTVNYLKHWEDGMYKRGQEKYPVVNVSLEDAKAYADWAGKRLPREIEWQLAAQGIDGRKWPWGNEFQGTKCNNSFGRLTPVDAFPKGDSQYGVSDLVGNIWQLMGDIYDNGTNYFAIIRGGSYYDPTSSRWYVKGGAQPLDKTQMMLLVSPGFDRNSTVGFRCVRDY